MLFRRGKEAVMKKARTAIIVALVLVVLLMGCAGATFSLTSYEGKRMAKTSAFQKHSR